MTTTYTSTLKCAVCGDSSSHRLLGSTSAFGSYDLDLRPPPPARYTLGAWAQECPSCGYVGESIEELSSGAGEIVSSPEYRELRSKSSELDLVQRFKRHALLWSHDPERAGWAMLHAAWVCDDMYLPTVAGQCRQECSDLWIGVDWTADPSGIRGRVVLVDVMRRSEQFEEASALIGRLLKMPALNNETQTVLRFQQLLISRYDRDAYTCEDAFTGVAIESPMKAP